MEGIEVSDMHQRVAELADERRIAVEGNGRRSTEAQKAKGKLTVRERVELFFDDGTFTEIETFRRHRAQGFGMERKRPPTDGVVIGWGFVAGRRVFVYAHDFRI